MRMNPAQMKDFVHEVTTPDQVVQDTWAGLTSTKGVPLTAPIPQEIYAARVYYPAEDTNSNGYRDSNGYYFAYLVKNNVFDLGSPFPVAGSGPLQINMRVIPNATQSSKVPSYDVLPPGTLVVGPQYGITANSPTSSDDNNIILKANSVVTGQLLGKTKADCPTLNTVNVEIWNGELAHEVDAHLTVLAYNLFFQFIASGSWVWLGLNDLGGYYILQIPHQQVQVVTDIQFDGAGHFQYKTFQIMAPVIGSESSWTTWSDATPCTCP